MQAPRPVGPGAASRKYDILSALMAFALSQDKSRQRQVLRLMALITSRYNWQRDELSMGQDDIARLWSVDPRTVKRELASLRAQGWLVLKRRGARGRVSVHGLDLERMLADTRPVWPNIGPDFVERMVPKPAQAGQGGAGNVVPLRAPAPAPRADGSVWSGAQARLHAQDPATYGAWLHSLVASDRVEGVLTLTAPTAFHATYVTTHLADLLTAAVRAEDPTIARVRVLS